MINILFFVLCLVASSTSERFEGIQGTPKEDLELERMLKLINKPPIKSIHTKFGYIVDCVDINKQPAFDHPLLKNHKLQRKPSFQRRIGKTSGKISSTKSIFGLKNDHCPRGTVPIRRTTKDDLIRGKSFFKNHILEGAPAGNHVAEVTLITNPQLSYYGVSGINSIYHPTVEKDQSSHAIMWVRNGPIEDTNLIGVGWHVVPQLYNDDATHVYVVWTTDNLKKTGCYNLQCSGFVQTNQDLYLGERLDNYTSVYGGVKYEIAFSIFQDSETKNWWINLQNENIGYFPASLFSNMTSADQVGWGGRTTTAAGAPSPQMGSGYFPDDSFVHASYFRHVAFQNESRKDYRPEQYMTQTFTDKPNCFGAKYYGGYGGDVSNTVQFGGPGGNCDN